MSENKKPKSILRRIVKWVAWIAGSIVALILILVTLMVWILTPGRLTPIVTDIANENLNAEVTLSRAELTFWKTFPTLYIELDSLTLKSGAFTSLDTAQRRALPEYADTLAHVGYFRGGVNVLALLAGNISLHDVELSGSRVNAVAYDSTTVNYDIVPPGDEKESPEPLSLPDISINRFVIADSLPVRYISLADSINIGLTLHRSDVISSEKPAYRLQLNSSVAALLPPDVNIDSMSVTVDGNIEWEHGTPEKFLFKDFTIAMTPVSAIINAAISLGTPVTIEELRINIDRLPVMETLAMIPQQWRPDLSGITTRMTADIAVNLTRPYPIDSKGLPWVDGTLEVPQCDAVYDGYEFDRINLSASASFNGDNPDASTATLAKLSVTGEGVGVDINGSIASPISNPAIKGHIKANVNLANLPKSLLSMFPGTVKGRIQLDTDAQLHLNDLTPKRFHKILLNGDLDLNDIDLSSSDIGIDLYTRNACIKLGTNNGFVSDNNRVDSLLTASVRIDTLSMNIEGIDVALRDLKGGIGCSNKASSADTTAINPIGGTINIARLRYSDPDSTKVFARDLYAHASLQRFEEQARLPLMNVGAGIGSIFYADSMNRVILRKGNINATAHMRPVKPMNPRMKQRYDSIAALNPDATPDSVMRIMRRSMAHNRRMEMSQYDVVDFGVDTSTKRLLRKWNVAGSITAERGRLFTPYFPVRNRLSHIDVKFSTDSVILSDVKYRAGSSDFTINGGVRNMRRALTSGRPLRVNLTVKSDTLNINELVQASYKGAAFADRIKDGSVKLAPIDSESDIDHLADSVTADGMTAALLVPVNIDADISMEADNIIYSNMYMSDFNGELLVKDGAINLRDLSAKSGIGDARFTALYTAPTKKDIRFGFGLELSEINIKEFIGMMPAVDSLMPLLQSFQGKIDADIAATAKIDSVMNIELPSLNAAVKLEGRDLVLLDAETFRTLSKWLLFKDKKTNVIPHMAVEMLVEDSKLEMFPFVFDFDRYRLAVMGSNDLAMNFKYHVSVLKSPIPFKFGINLSGNADKMKVRLGRAKYKPDKAGETFAIVDTTRINLLKEIDNVFRRGARNARLGALRPEKRPDNVNFDELNDTITHEDSVMFINQGLLPAPPKPEPVEEVPAAKTKDKKKKK